MRSGWRLPSGEPFERLSCALVLGALVPALFAIGACSSGAGGGAVIEGGGAKGGEGGLGSGTGSQGGSLDGFFATCDLGDIVCDGDVATSCENASARRDCGAEGLTCASGLGCVSCIGGQGSCENGHATLCKPDGSGFDEFECDSEQGMRCDPDGCKGECSPAALGSSYIGCDYFPTVTPNPVYSGFHFAVAVANSGSTAARIRVTRGADTVAEAEVPAGDLRTLELPWVNELKGGDQNACQIPPPVGPTQLLANGAYRLRTDRPVSVYQFNPLRYQLTPTPADCPLRNACPGSPPRPNEGCLSFSNDATLLFPVNVLRGAYRVMAWPSAGAGQAFVSVVGTRPNTRVHIDGRGTFVPGAGLAEAGSGEVVLNAGDVLQLIAAPSAGRSFGSDPTGTAIEADAPVQVISGSSCGFVPEATTDACDHLEQALLPNETLGKDYLVSFPAAPGSLSPHVIRVLAVLPDTQITFDPPLPEVGASRLQSPEDGALTIPGLMQDVHVSADKPLVITQYMQGQSSVDSGAGDPSMALAVPSAQYRDNYIFAVSGSYDYNFLNVVAPIDATVLLDGEALPHSEFSPIGSTRYAVARHLLPADREVFRIESSVDFGILVYGYGTFTSYMYPGGLDLEPISPPIIR